MTNETTSASPIPFTGPERRAEKRIASTLPITVREAGRHQLPATLTSLSSAGCSVSGVTLTSGDNSVWIRIPGLESQSARRSWSNTGAAGFMFEHPLHPAVANRFTEGEQATWQPLPQPMPAPAPMLAADNDRSRSRREQILAGLADVSQHLTSDKPARQTATTLAGMIRRHTARVVDQRLETRFPPPANAALAFSVSGEPAKIDDLSPSGVRVSREIGQEIGAPVKIAFAGFPPMEGTVVWIRNGATGVRLPDNALDLFEAA